jgi:hypothetical protein
MCTILTFRNKQQLSSEQARNLPSTHELFSRNTQIAQDNSSQVAKKIIFVTDVFAFHINSTLHRSLK